MTFKTVVNMSGQIALGDDAARAGFAAGRPVEVIRTVSGALIVVLDDSPALEVPYRLAPPAPRRALVEAEPPFVRRPA